MRHGSTLAALKPCRSEPSATPNQGTKAAASLTRHLSGAAWSFTSALTARSGSEEAHYRGAEDGLQE